MSGASERANGRASGPVLQSVFLAVFDHSDLEHPAKLIPESAAGDDIDEEGATENGQNEEIHHLTFANGGGSGGGGGGGV